MLRRCAGRSLVYREARQGSQKPDTARCDPAVIPQAVPEPSLPPARSYRSLGDAVLADTGRAIAVAAGGAVAFAPVEYVLTLAAYLRHMGRLRLAAAELGIHRNTLEYRVGRIAQLAETDLDNADNRLALELGVRLLELNGSAMRGAIRPPDGESASE